MDHQGISRVTARRSGGGPKAVRALRGAGVVGGLSQSLAGAAGALLARVVSGGEGAAGWPQAALVVGSAAAAVTLGQVTRRQGRRTALTTGAVVAAHGAVVVVVGAGLGSLAVVLLGSVLLGAGNTTVMLGRYAAGELAPVATRARQMGWVLAATAVGAVLGPALLGPSAAITRVLGLPDHTGAYVVVAAGYAVTAAVLVVGMHELPHGRSIGPGEPMVDRSRSRSRAAMGARGLRALAVLGLANLVMVTVMTMAPVHLHDRGVHLTGIGLVVGAHVAGMFAVSPLTGWLVDLFGARPLAAVGGGLLAAACLTVTLAGGSSVVLVAGLTLLGLGWNAALVAGSDWLSDGATTADRPRLEGYGEVAMGVAAAVGAVLSGLVVSGFGYPVLAAACALVSVLVVPLAVGAPHLTRVGRALPSQPVVASPSEEVAR